MSSTRHKLSRLARSFRSDLAGFTLIEQLVVICIISITAAGFVGFVDATFNTAAKGNQQLETLQTRQEVNGWMASHLALAQRPIGLLKAGGASIDPLTIAGDQVVFEQADGTCVRVFYVRALKRIKATVASSCGEAKIKPVRGPNQDAANGTRTANPGDADYDLALDKPSGQADASFTIAEGITPEKPADAPVGSTQPLSPFAFLGVDRIPQSVDASASSSLNGHTSWYATPSNRSAIDSIDVSVYALPVLNPIGAKAKYSKQNVSLQQVQAEESQ